MVSLGFLVAVVTSADIHPWSLSANQTLVPFE